jgi:hypothetical protein
VFVNGQRVGRTPLSWTQGNAGEKVSVEYRMEGHASVRFEEQVPEPGQSDSVSHTLQAVASEPGRLSVNVSRGWANVYIDGRKLAETTPLANHALPPGEHTIRVSNPELGIEQSRKITVRSGASERVSFTVD